MRILLIEDDKKLSTIIRSFLQKSSYVCDVAFTAESAEAKLAKSGYDAIILDVILPDGSGVELSRKLRKNDVTTPIIMLTARTSTVDKITGLDAGADDYMPKPFSPQELQARIRAVTRRPQQVISNELTCGNISLNSAIYSVKKDGKDIRLMPTEFSLLEQLMRKKNQVVKKSELLRSVWGIYSNTSTNRLEVYIRYLREKVDNPFDPQLIKTVRGMGYKIADE